MTDKPLPPDLEFNADDDVSVWEAIQAFETILEAFPEDVSALESLAVAYDQAGDGVRAREKTFELARLLGRQGEWGRVSKLAEQLLERNPEDEEAEKLLAVAEKEGGASAPADPQPASEHSGSTVEVGPSEESGRALTFDLRGELDLAWFLLQRGKITQEQYEKAIEGLTELRMKPSQEMSLSLLLELATMDRVDIEGILDFLCQETNTPFVDLHRFEPQASLLELISLNQCRRLGVLPFEKLGEEVMVAVLNPVDKEMRKTLERHLGTNVHFYLCAPEDFLHAVEQLASLGA